MTDKYDVTVVIPYYRKYNEFMYALLYNHKYFEQMNEVIILIDENLDSLTDFAYLNDYNINFRFFMNEENHGWRNPAVVLNKGINEAKSKKVIIMSPETIIMEDSLKKLIDNCDDESFSVGPIIFMNDDFYYKHYKKELFEIYMGNPIRSLEMIGPVMWGSICCTKENFEKVECYGERFSLKGWGGEDNDVRAKLERNGIKKKVILSAKFIHLESKEEICQRYLYIKNFRLTSIENMYNVFNEVNINGLDNNIFKNVLDKIEDIKDYKLSNNISSYYPIVLLTQCYNETNNVKDYIKNVSNFVDAIIVLDDDSTDNTWELLDSNKIILKIKTKRENFNDLKNRNLLLNVFEDVFVRNNVKVDWFMWLDFDERLTENLDFLTYNKKMLLSSNFQPEILSLPLYHMWDNICYNSEYPYSINGKQPKKRLIKNNPLKMPYKINSNGNLHFSLSPYDGKHKEIMLQIKHLSYIDKESRIKKYDLYTKNYDSEGIQNSYEHFLKDDVKLIPYDDIMLFKEKKENDLRLKLGDITY